jgi:pimeloyl-ACP methyl ester carboxylesterase
VVHGISIGVGIAVPLAARNQLRGLILQSPFTDLPAVAQAVFFFLPCRLLLKDRYDNRALLSGVTESTLVIHGTRDRTIRLEQGRAVADALPNLSAFAEAKGYGHNDLLAWPGYWPRIEAYLRGSK